MTYTAFANSIETEAMPWALAKKETVEYKGVQFLVSSGDFTHDLPIEFFSHELMAVDALDDAQLIAFAAEFGMMWHPLRCGCLEVSAIDRDMEREIKSAMRGTGLGARAPIGEFPYKKNLNFVSVEEMRTSVICLQREISSMFSYLRGYSESWYGHYSSNTSMGCLTAFGYATHNGRVAQRQRPRNMTRAICSQIMEFITSDSPMRECACEGCGRLFKRYQPSKSEYISRYGKNPPNPKYCCKQCRDKQTQRNYRAKRKLMNS